MNSQEASQRIKRLLNPLQAAAAGRAQAKPQDGMDSGRHSTMTANIAKRREKAELKLKYLVRQLRQAVKRRPPRQ